MDVQVGFTEFEKELFASTGALTPFVIEPFLRSVDPGPIPYDQAPMSSPLGKKDVRFIGGSNFVTRFTREYNRGGTLNEDNFPWPNETDEINSIVYLFNTFSNTEVSNKWSNTVSGKF